MYELLTLVALILIFLFGGIGLIFGTVVSWVNGTRKQYFKGIAVALDQFGNTVCCELFNVIFITKSGYKFGNPDFTVSEILAINKLNGTLLGFGKLLCRLLIFMNDSAFK